MTAGLLRMLDKDDNDEEGSSSFANVLTGERKDPEVIWNRDTRHYLITAMRRHLGDFPVFLQEHNVAAYDYRPASDILYDSLKTDVYCGVYYLENLIRQPRWSIEHLSDFFRAFGDEWKRLRNEGGAADDDASMTTVALLMGRDKDSGGGVECK